MKYIELSYSDDLSQLSKVHYLKNLCNKDTKIIGHNTNRIVYQKLNFE